MKKSYNLFLGIFFIFLSLFGVVFSQNEIEYLYFDVDVMTENNVIAYQVFVEEPSGSLLEVKISYNNSLLEKVCEIKTTDFRAKKVCEIDSLGNGLYKFDATLYNPSGDILDTLSVEEYFFDGVTARYEFELLEDKALVNLVIGGEGGNVVVLNQIPKEVIEYLDDENRENLITSNFEYEILEADPLIAWSVDRVPGNINYSINKKIDSSDLENFDIEVAKGSTSFKLVKFLVIILLIVIIGFVFKPVFVKKKRK